MAYNYWCSNRRNCPTCAFCNAKGDLVINESSNDFICPNNESVSLKEMGQQVHGKVGPKMTKAAIVKDRKQRSQNHFKKEVLPELGNDEKLHFQKKYDTNLGAKEIKKK